MRTKNLAALLAVLAPLSCASGDAKPASAKTASTEAAKTGAKNPGLPVYDELMDGKREIAFKKKVAEQSARRLFIDFGTNACAACRVLNDAINEPRFQGPFLRQFVPAYIDVSPGSSNLEILQAWHIDPAKGLPAIAIVDEKGQLLEVTQEGEMAREAAKGKDEAQAWILKRFRADN